MSVTTRAERDLEAVLARNNAESGIVVAERGKHRRMFCLNDGFVIYALSNVIEEQFEERLVEWGALGPGESAGIRRDAAAAGVKVGSFLRARGTPPEDVLVRMMDRHVRELLDDTLEWTGGRYRFDAGIPDLRDEPLAAFPVAECVIERCRDRPKTVQEVRARLGPEGVRLRIDPEAGKRVAAAVSQPAVHYLLEACDGERPLEAVLSESPLEHESTIRTLFALTRMGIAASIDAAIAGAAGAKPVTREEFESRHAQAEAGNHYMVLGVGTEADSGAIREAYYFLARRFHPDRFRATPMADLMEKVEAYFSRVTEAYNTLSDSVARRAYDEQLIGERPRDEEPKKDAAYLARENYARGKLLIERGQFRDSVQFLENAIELDRKAPYLIALAQAIGRNPRQRGEAMEHLEQALALDPTAVDGHVALAELQIRAGDTDGASESIGQALHWNPNHPQAQALAESLAGKRKQGRKGLFRG